jgi:hypothetical protein
VPDLHLGHPESSVTVGVEVVPADRRRVEVRNKEVRRVGCILEAGEDAVAERGAVGANRDGDAGSLPDEHLHVRPVRRGAESSPEPCQLGVKGSGRPTERLDIRAHAGRDRAGSRSIAQVIDILTRALQAAFPEETGGKRSPFEFAQDPKCLRIEVGSSDRPRFPRRRRVLCRAPG